MEYIKLLYYYFNFEDCIVLMFELRKEGFLVRKFVEFIKRYFSMIYCEFKRNSINDVY